MSDPLSRLTLDDVSKVCGEVIRDQRKQILQHVNRLHVLYESKLKAAEMREEKSRARHWSLHTRVSELENEVKRLRRAMR
jgi:hypothetical protein